MFTYEDDNLAICNGILPPREQNIITNASLLAHAGRHQDAEFQRRGAGYDRSRLLDMDKLTPNAERA